MAQHLRRPGPAPQFYPLQLRNGAWQLLRDAAALAGVYPKAGGALRSQFDDLTSVAGVCCGLGSCCMAGA